jgi:NHL repeat
VLLLSVGLPPAALYVPSGTANTVNAYSLPFTSSDEAPSQTLTGAETGLDEPTGVAVEPDGRLYVGNAGNNSVTEYAYGANGDAAPVATISGPDTGLDVPGKLVLDSSGYLFVTNNLDATVTEYAPGASGDATPIATVTGFDRVGGITAGDGLVAVGDSEANTVSSYTDSAGVLTPFASLAGADTLLDGPTGMGIDDNGHLFVADAGGASVASWAAGAGGDTAPSTDLTGADTGLDVPADVAADADGDIFVANLGSSTITEYAADATGDTAPTAVLGGPDTQLSGPAALALLP